MASSGQRPTKKKRANSQSMQSFKRPRIDNHLKAMGAVTSNSPEWKNLDTTASLTPGASNIWSALTCQNLMVQGTGLQEHVGRKIAIQKITFRYNASIIATTNLGNHRILMVYDNHPNGGTPAITDILTNDAFTGLMNLNNSDRFRVIFDIYPFEKHGLSCEGGSGISNFCGGVITKKFNPPLLQQFNTVTTATIGAIQVGAIWLMFCQSNTTASPAASLVHFTRVRFIDN